MATVKGITWEEAASPDFGNPARVAWREAVVEIAAKAKGTWPQCHARVDSAVKIVLAGDVELLADGKAKIASQWLDAKGSQPTDDTPQCPKHGVTMKLNHGKDGRTWYSHKTADGWCKGR